MKLNANEILAINKRLDGYHIIYQEIYDEFLDHIVTAIETARANKDQRNVKVIFYDVVGSQFSGDGDFKKIQLKYVLAYNKKIRKALFANFKYYLNWPNVLLALALITAGFYLPKTKNTPFILLFALIIAAFWPYLYVVIKAKHIKPSRKKVSLVKSFVISCSQFLALIVYIILFVFRLISSTLHVQLLSPAHYLPVIYTVLLSFFYIYGLSSMRLCRQELKIDINNSTL